MNIITVDEEVWKHLNERLKAISEYILKLEDTSYDSLWLNNHEVCQYLHISEKTLWRMRTNGQIAFSKMYGQYYYTIGAIKEMLNANAVQTTNEYVEELMAKGKSYIDLLQMLKISNRSLQRYRSIGKLPYYTISGKLYYKLSDVHQFIRESFNPPLPKLDANK